MASQKAAAPAPTPRMLVPSCSLHRLHGLHCSYALHLMALIAWPSSHGFIVLGRARVRPSSHGPHRMAVIAWLHCAWQGQGARLTSQKAAAPAPTPRILVPSCSLHRIHGLHLSHGLHRMALIAWLHRAWQDQGARLTSQKAAAPAPTPGILVLNSSIAWPSSHGFIVLGRARVLG